MIFLQQGRTSERVLHERHSRSNPELRKRNRLTDEGNKKKKKGRREMKLATPSLPAKEAPLISRLYSGSRKPAGQS